MEAVEEFEFVSVKDELDEDKLAIQAAITHCPSAEETTDPLSIEERVQITRPAFGQAATDTKPVKDEVRDSGQTELRAMATMERVSKLEPTVRIGAVRNINHVDAETSRDTRIQNTGMAQQVPLGKSTCGFISTVFTSMGGVTNVEFPEINDAFHVYHTCEMCGEVFPSALSLTEHLLVCQENQSEEHAGQCVCESAAAGECGFCRKSLVQSALLERQPRTTPQVPSPSGRVLNKKSAVKEVYTSKCNICDESSATSKCLHCKKSAHTAVRPYKCSVGNKIFFPHSKAQKCIRTGAKVYKCEICGKCFCRNSYLSCHKRTHSGGEPYKCGFCDLSFSNISLLADHKCTRFYSGLRVNKCEVCGNFFHTLQDLATHKRVHWHHQCTACNRRFSSLYTRIHHKCVKPERENSHRPNSPPSKSKELCETSNKFFNKKYAVIQKRVHVADLEMEKTTLLSG